MKKIIGIFILALFVVLAYGQTVSETKVLSSNEDYPDYSYYSFKQGASDALTGTQDSAYYTVRLNKHYPCDVKWSVTLDTAYTADSANLSVLWQYRSWGDENWNTVSTTSYDGDTNGSVTFTISDSSKINTAVLPLTDKVFAREHRLFIKPTAGAGLGSFGDKVMIEKVEFKAIVRK